MSNVPGWADEAGAAGAGAGAPNEGTNSFAPRLGFHEAAFGLSESFDVACDSESWFWLIVACVVKAERKRLSKILCMCGIYFATFLLRMWPPN